MRFVDSYLEFGSNVKTSCVLSVIKGENRFILKQEKYLLKLYKLSGSLYVSGKLPTYPFPKPININTYFSLTAKCWLRGGVGGQVTILGIHKLILSLKSRQ